MRPPTSADRQIAAWLFLLSLGTYAFFFGGSGFNQNASFDQARAIVERHTLAINAYAANTYDVAVRDGRVYPNKPPGTTLLAVAPYALLYAIERAAGADAAHFPLLTLNLYAVTLLVCGVSGALIPPLLFLYARRRGVERRWAAIVALLIAFGAPLFAYSTMLFLHVPSALFLLLAVDATLDPEGPRAAAAGAFAGAAGLTNYLCLPAIVPLAIALLGARTSGPQSPDVWSGDDRPPRAVARPEVGRLRTGGPRAILRFVLGGFPFALALLAYQQAAFGHFTRSSIALENPAFLQQGKWLGILAAPSLRALWGVTFSPYRGLFFMSPMLLLVAFGRARKAEAAVVAAIALYFLLFNSAFNGWFGGYAIGPRYLLPVVPLLGILLLDLRPRLRPALIALGALSIAINFVATAVDPQPPDTVRNPIVDYELPLLVHGEVPPDRPVPQWLRALYTGHVAVNRVAADEPLPFVRHPPGSPASEWASFNLGETILPQGHWSSLLPVLVWMLGGAWLLIMRAAKTEVSLGRSTV